MQITQMNLRAVLKCHGDGVSVDTSHEETEETSHSQELLESCSVDGSNLKKTQDDHVENHGPLSTKLVSSYTEHGSADRAEQQRQSDGCRDGGV
jgi:hypothetical protein